MVSVAKVTTIDSLLSKYWYIEPTLTPARSTIPVWAIHHDERWYPRPYHFDPERWTKDAERARPRYSFFPFGGGNRVCIGEAFARMEARLVLARVLQLFTPKTLINTPPKLGLTITLRAETPIPVEFQRRVVRGSGGAGGA